MLTGSEASLSARVAALEIIVDRLQRASVADRGGGAPDGAYQFPGLDPEDEYSLARARLSNAEAERVELENATARRALILGDDSLLAGYSLSLSNEPSHPRERILRISFDDGVGRTAAINLPFALALKLNSSIGRAVAERLDAAGER